MCKYTQKLMKVISKQDHEIEKDEHKERKKYLYFSKKLDTFIRYLFIF
jgi:glutaredoxin